MFLLEKRVVFPFILEGLFDLEGLGTAARQALPARSRPFLYFPQESSVSAPFHYRVLKTTIFTKRAFTISLVKFVDLLPLETRFQRAEEV
jgi:hypothetical protein